jgi:hypothetical protein
LWRDNERPTHVYCGQPSERSWCEEHKKRCFGTYKTEPTEDRARNWGTARAHTPLTDTFHVPWVDGGDVP